MISSTVKEFVHNKSEALLLTFKAYEAKPELAVKLQETCQQRLFEFTQGSPIK